MNNGQSQDFSKQQIVKDFRDYTIRKQQSEDQVKRDRGEAGGKNAKSGRKKQEKNVFEALLGMCSWYLCGLDTTAGTFVIALLLLFNYAITVQTNKLLVLSNHHLHQETKR